MKKTIILVMVLMCAVLVHAQTAFDNQGVIVVNMVNQEPDPVGPGEYVDVRWMVQNLGSDSINNIEVELMPEYPFSLDPGDDSTKLIPSLSPRQNDASSYVVKYKVRVDSNAIEGNNTLKLRYKVGNSIWTTAEYTINVQTRDANLGIMSVETVPTVVMPGDNFNLNIKVKNLADSTLKDVSIKMDMLLSTISSGATSSTTKSEILDSLPFAPVKSATEQRIRNIAPGQEVTFTYSLVAYPDAQAKVYKVPIEVNYYDTLGKLYSKDDVIGLIVESKPDLSALLEQTDITSSGQKGTVTVKIVNKGLVNVKFMDVKMAPTDQFELLSPDEVYIGNIDSDDYETADFDIYVQPGVTGDVAIPVTYQYMDANNNKYTDTADLTLKLYTKEQAQALGVQKSNTTVIVIAIVVVLIIGFLIFRAVRKKRKV